MFLATPVLVQIYKNKHGWSSCVYLYLYRVNKETKLYISGGRIWGAYNLGYRGVVFGLCDA